MCYGTLLTRQSEIHCRKHAFGQATQRAHKNTPPRNLPADLGPPGRMRRRIAVEMIRISTDGAAYASRGAGQWLALDRPRSSGRLAPALVGCNCAPGVPGHRVARVGAAFRRALRSPAEPLNPVGVPARLRACSQARPRVAGERRARSVLNDAPAHVQNRLKSATIPMDAEIRSESGG